MAKKNKPRKKSAATLSRKARSEKAFNALRAQGPWLRPIESFFESPEGAELLAIYWHLETSGPVVMSPGIHYIYRSDDDSSKWRVGNKKVAWAALGYKTVSGIKKALTHPPGEDKADFAVFILPDRDDPISYNNGVGIVCDPQGNSAAIIQGANGPSFVSLDAPYFLDLISEDLVKNQPFPHDYYFDSVKRLRKELDQIKDLPTERQELSLEGWLRSQAQPILEMEANCVHQIARDLNYVVGPLAEKNIHHEFSEFINDLGDEFDLNKILGDEIGKKEPSQVVENSQLPAVDSTARPTPLPKDPVQRSNLRARLDTLFD